ncbi:MAG TPA: DinB family protein [Anaerolineales bacterium]|nr:DinB family protein [Anaerolineales bacterium]
MTPEERTAQIADYGNAYALLTAALARFPREMWHFRPSPDEWTIHEIVVHITDSEANSYIRARRLIAEPGSMLMGYDEMQWARALDYHHLDTEDAVELFRWLRGNTHKLIQTLPEPVWQNIGHHTESGPITLEDWLDIYTRHVPEHVAQMERVWEKWKKGPSS